MQTSARNLNFGTASQSGTLVLSPVSRGPHLSAGQERVTDGPDTRRDAGLTSFLMILLHAFSMNAA